MSKQSKIIISELLEKLDLLIKELHEIDIKITFKTRRRRGHD